MKNLAAFTFLTFFALFTHAQEKQRPDTLNIDLDKDSKTDQVIFDREKAIIIVKLSTHHFKPMFSEQMEIDPVSSGVREKRGSFEFANNWMRAGYTCQFRYNAKAKKMQLIGMTRYEFGPANNDGSGESSVNLLTNNYIGNWNYWDDDENRLVAMPPIKRKMIFAPTYLSGFDSAISKYTDLCSKLYYQHKKSILAKKTR
ncbi:hypothetical protein [Pedobacter aquatilis]|uniref:hypothetical protein n=1 Tax=Pedobacter aquatilis TaxID=351343 RepID=UPI00292CF0DB|nr:hypothetical protein [Pedobacter aquatilis]